MLMDLMDPDNTPEDYMNESGGKYAAIFMKMLNAGIAESDEECLLAMMDQLLMNDAVGFGPYFPSLDKSPFPPLMKIIRRNDPEKDMAASENSFMFSLRVVTALLVR